MAGGRAKATILAASRVKKCNGKAVTRALVVGCLSSFEMRNLFQSWTRFHMSTENDVMSDLDFEITEEAEEDEALPAPRYEIFSYPADTTLKGYLDQWNNDQLYVPPFQRNYIWDQTRASKLVESFLLGLPVPPVFLFKPTSAKQISAKRSRCAMARKDIRGA